MMYSAETNKNDPFTRSGWRSAILVVICRAGGRLKATGMAPKVINCCFYYYRRATFNSYREIAIGSLNRFTGQTRGGSGVAIVNRNPQRSIDFPTEYDLHGTALAVYIFLLISIRDDAFKCHEARWERVAIELVVLRVKGCRKCIFPLVHGISNSSLPAVLQLHVFRKRAIPFKPTQLSDRPAATQFTCHNYSWSTSEVIWYEVVLLCVWVKSTSWPCSCETWAAFSV